MHSLSLGNLEGINFFSVLEYLPTTSVMCKHTDGSQLHNQHVLSSDPGLVRHEARRMREQLTLASHILKPVGSKRTQ